MTEATIASPDESRDDALVASGLVAGYGASTVLHGVDISAASGEIVAVLGHNGAGKSTLLRVLAGHLRVIAGHVRIGGVDVTDQPVAERVRRGVAYAPQQDFVFRELSVRDNLRLASFSVSDHRRTATVRDEVFELFPILRERLDQRAGTLSGGEQRMLSIAISLLTDPSVILLDEPSLGISPRLVTEVMDALRALVRDHDVAIVVAEQNVKQAVEHAHRIVVLRRGEVVHRGPSVDLLGVDRVWDLF